MFPQRRIKHFVPNIKNLNYNYDFLFRKRYFKVYNIKSLGNAITEIYLVDNCGRQQVHVLLHGDQ